MNNKILVVYNLCGISGKEDLNLYKQCINAVLSQNYSNYHLCISSCLNSEAIRNDLLFTFKNKAWFNFIDDRVPVNVSFNHSVRECLKKESFDGFLYLSSDVELENLDTLKILDHHFSDEYGMISIQVDNDNSFNNSININDNYIIKPGQSVNNHCTLFSNSVYNYYGQAMPDIFAAYSSESVFFYINSGIGKKWMILNTPKAKHHRHRNDGATSGFCHTGPLGIPWDNLFNSPKKISEILVDPLAKQSGFGYEEYFHIFDHDPSQFDENYLCKNTILAPFVKDNMFLKEINFNYNNIKGKFIYA